jgi:NAD(P)-dependent dehydrogenase (short-subunit alcohol dehydrogenase family)
VVAVADVSDEAAVRAAAADVSKHFASLDLLVNNAGVLLDEDRATDAAGLDPHILEATLAVNLYGAVHACNAFLPMMHSDSRIINVSSTMGQLSDGSAGYAPAYCISKTALNAYTQALAEALRPRAIMVDCFHPGWAKTAMGGPRATVKPEEAARVALFLATRPHSVDQTGKFWRHNGVIDW